MTPSEAYKLGQTSTFSESLPPGMGRHWARGFYESNGGINSSEKSIRLGIKSHLKTRSKKDSCLDYFDSLLRTELDICCRSGFSISIRQDCDIMVTLTWMYSEAENFNTLHKQEYETLHAKKLYVYLAGPMLPKWIDPYYSSWRRKTQTILRKNGAIGLDPYHSKEEVCLDPTGVTSELPPGTVFQKDYWMIRTAHKVLVNLTVNGQSGPFPRFVVGTFFEMGMAWERGIPIYTVIESKNECFRKHPFILSTSEVITASVPEAVKIILDEDKHESSTV